MLYIALQPLQAKEHKSSPHDNKKEAEDTTDSVEKPTAKDISQSAPPSPQPLPSPLASSDSNNLPSTWPPIYLGDTNLMSSSKSQSGIVCTAMECCMREALEHGDPCAFPVIYRARKAPTHEGLPYTIFKELRKSIRENGLQNSFTVGLIEAIGHNYIVTP